jgi:tyrosyl-tRNA synthetase
MFGKLMSVSDDLMWRYIELLSFVPLDTVAQWKSQVDGGANPRDVKIRFAQEIVERFHDRRAADGALDDWNARFRDGGVPENLEEKVITVATGDAAIAQVLKSSGLCPSTSEALRMIEQRGVKVNGDTVADKALKLAAGFTYVLQVGKRKFARVTLKRAA